MIEKNDPNEKPVDDESASTGNEKNDTPSTPTVHNPFEGGSKEVTPEELESLEQFKEAQTERD